MASFTKPQLLKSALNGAKCFSTSTQVKNLTYLFNLIEDYTVKSLKSRLLFDLISN